MKTDGEEGPLVEIERKLRLAIPDIRSARGVEEIDKPSLRGAGRSVAILAAPSTEENLAGMIDVVNKRRSVFFIVVGGDISARRYKQLIESGNAEWVADSSATEEILGLVARAAAGGAGASNQTIIVSFMPSAGGVGNSTLAIETALQLIRRKAAAGAKIALIDLDFQSSHVCDYLDVSPKFRIEEIIAAPERLDDQLLEVFTTRHSSGLDVFAAPRDPLHLRDISVETLSALLERMARQYAYIIVDLPVSAHSWTIPLLTASEAIFVTGVNTIPGLRQIAQILSDLGAEPGMNAEVRTVINRCEFGLFGGVVRSDHIDRVLGEKERFYVRNTSVALECANLGEAMTLARPSEKAVKDIAEIATFCMALKPLSVRPA